MAASKNPATADAPASGTRRTRRHAPRRVLVIGAATALVLIVGLGAGLGALAHAATLTNCVASPSVCGYPDATNSGVPAGTTLKTVPGQVSSGSGWHFDATNQQLDVTANDTVLSGLSIPYNVNVTGSNVTLSNDQIVTGGPYAVSIRHVAGVTIKNSTITGQNATTGRVNIAIGDLYGDSTGITLAGNNISAFRTAISVSSGQITGNYIHDPGYQSGDHTNGILGSGTQQLTITHNTILNNLGQTDAISIDTSTGTTVSNKTISNNLLAGGSYPIYGGASLGNATSNVVIQDNRFAQNYFHTSGQYGPVTYFQSTGTGNSWSGNVWDSTGQVVPSP